MCAKPSRLFERHFAGKDNAGLRKLIRDSLPDVPSCGPRIERAIRGAIEGRIALTAKGHANLELVISDYRAVNGDFNHRCDCDACVAGSLQLLGGK